MDFRARLVHGTPMIGTFVKNTEPHSVEILGVAGLDFVLLDAEHAPFDRRAIDLALLACRASGISGAVRVPDDSAKEILNALDLGADAVVVPHVRSARRAQAVVAACRHSGVRGYSNSTRAGAYGSKALWPHVDEADDAVAVIAMVEDADAVERIDEILAVDGLDAVMLGRNDLLISMRDRDRGDARVDAATNRVIAAAERAGKQVLLFVGDTEEARVYRRRGVQSFIIASDQSMLRRAARAIVVDAASM